MKRRITNVIYSRNYSSYFMVIRCSYFDNNWWIYPYLVGNRNYRPTTKSYTRKTNSLRVRDREKYENHEKYWISIIRCLVDLNRSTKSCCITNTINGLNLIYLSHRIWCYDCTWKIALKKLL